MSDLTFTFGFSDALFFSTPSSTCWHNLSPELNTRLKEAHHTPDIISNPTFLSLGPNRTFLIGYHNPLGSSRLAWNWTEYSPLELFKNWSSPYPLTQKRCVCGPNRAFFGLVVDSHGEGQGRGVRAPYMWKGVPKGLESIALKDGGNPIVGVNLGAGGTWVAFRADGTVDWAENANGEVFALLRVAPPGSVTHVSLSPDNPEYFFIAYADGSSRYVVPKGAAEKVRITAELYREYIKAQVEARALIAAGESEVTVPPPSYSPGPGV